MADKDESLCGFADCSEPAIFGFKIDGRKTRCEKHKEKKMIKQCLNLTCFTRPTFNLITEKKPAYCGTHKKEGMEDIVNKKCLTHMCGTIISNKSYRGYCTRCFMYKYPDEKEAKNYKTKEVAMADAIKSKFPNIVWITDKNVGGCSLRRPDIYAEYPQNIIIECDENQHKSYDTTCEISRINNLSEDFAFKPIVFIRFNPDGYIKGSEKILSPWLAGKDGILRIPKTRAKEWDNRLKLLFETIQYWIDNKNEEIIKIVHLYYDE
jgi:hypothetical protein